MDIPKAVGVHEGPVAVDPRAGQPRPVRLQVPLALPPEASRHPGPRLADHELTDAAAHRRAALVDHIGVHARDRPGEARRLLRRDHGARHDAAAHLGPARVVDDGATAAADHPLEPAPGVGVPRLARRAEDPEAREVAARDPVVARAHERADRGRRDPDDRQAMPLHHLPDPPRVREVGRAVVEEDGRAEHQAPADDPRPHHPPHIGEPEDRVRRLDVEAVGHILQALDREPALHMDHALGPPGRTRRVDYHVKLFGVRAHAVAAIGLGGDQFVPPDIALRVPGQPPAALMPQPSVDYHLLDAWRECDGPVRDLFGGDELPAALDAVAGDEDPRVAVLEPGGDGLGAEPGEDRREDGAELADRELGHHHLGNHRQQEADPVALLEPEGAQGVGAAACFLCELPVGEARGLAVLAFPDQRDLVPVGAGGVSVEGVVDVVEPGADPPRGPRRAPREVEDLRVRLVPLEPQVPDDRVPEAADVGHRPAEELLEAPEAVPGDEPGEVTLLDDRPARPPADLEGLALLVLAHSRSSRRPAALPTARRGAAGKRAGRSPSSADPAAADAPYCLTMLSSSTSKTSVAPGLICGGAPLSPYARSDGQMTRLFPPTFMSWTASVQHLITLFSGNVTGSPR